MHFEVRWMELETITPSEVTQTQSAHLKVDRYFKAKNSHHTTIHSPREARKQRGLKVGHLEGEIEDISRLGWE